MKLLVVASSAFPRWKGDADPPFVYELSKRLAEKGAKVVALLPHHPGSRRFEIISGVKVHRFRYFFPSTAERLCYGGGIFSNMKMSFLARLQLPFLVFAELFALWRLAGRERPDLIHAHWILPQGFAAALAGRLFGIPVVVTAHAGDVFPLDRPVFRTLSRFVISSSAAFTVNSNFTRHSVEKIAKPGNIMIIPMGVDLRRFFTPSPARAAAVRRKFDIGRNARLILFVGRLAEKKGVTYLISAMKVVTTAFPGCKLLVVGEGSERERLVAQSESLGLSGSVVFAGSVPNSTLAPYYAAADVFVLPSVIDSRGDTEGLGVVLLEAIAAGTPVVASNVGGIPDVVIEGKTGMLVPPKSPDALAAAIVSLLKDKSFGRKLASAAGKHVAKGYSWESVASRFYQLFSSVSKSKRF